MPKWEDTVMTHKQRVECSHNPNLELRERDMCQAQAEISFKAGREEATKWYDYIYDEGVKSGRKEVVDYLGVYENDLGFCEISNHTPYAKLKEWGFDDD